MRVLVICTVNLDKNGISTCILNYFQQIASLENVMDIVAPNVVSDEIKKPVEEKGMRIFELPFRKDNTIKYFWELFQIIKKGKYDIVHAHGNSCTLAIELLAAKIGGCKVRIAHSHNTTCEHIKMHMLLRPIFEMVCNGRFACGSEAGKWLFKKKPFVVIKNGVNIELYKNNFEVRDALRKKLQLSTNEILLGHIGVFNYQKNHEFLIEVFEKLCQYQENWRLICIGDGENRNKIETLVKEKKLTNKIWFTGNVNNIPDYLQAIDCLLLPSRYEGLPFVLVEAQAAGLTCLVSDKVDAESDISGNVRFLPLNISSWCNEIQKCSFGHKCNEKKIANAGFNIKTNAQVLLKEYRKLTGKFA